MVEYWLAVGETPPPLGNMTDNSKESTQPMLVQ